MRAQDLPLASPEKMAVLKFFVAGAEPFAKTAADLRTQLLRLKSKQPDLLYIVGLGPALAAAYRQAREVDLRSNRLGWLTCSQASVFEAAKWDLEGTYSLDPYFDPDSPEYRMLSNAVKIRKPGARLDHNVISEFDAVSIIAEAVSQGQFSAEDIRRYIIDKQIFAGASGRIEFTADGDCYRETQIMIIENSSCRSSKRSSKQR